MSKRMAKSQSTLQESKIAKTTKAIKNAVLQAAIESINSLIAQKVLMSADNGFALMNLAVAIEDAFRPAAKMLSEEEKNVKEQVNAIVERVGDVNELDEKTKKELNELQNSFTSRAKEILDIEVECEISLISSKIFTDRNGKPVDIDLSTAYSLRPFMKEFNES